MARSGVPARTIAARAQGYMDPTLAGGNRTWIMLGMVRVDARSRLGAADE